MAANAAEHMVPPALPAVVVDDEVEEEEDEEMVDPGRADAGVVLVETMPGEEDVRTADGVGRIVPSADSLGSSDVCPEPLEDDLAVVIALNLTSESEWSTSRSLMSSK